MKQILTSLAVTTLLSIAACGSEATSNGLGVAGGGAVGTPNMPAKPGIPGTPGPTPMTPGIPSIPGGPPTTPATPMTPGAPVGGNTATPPGPIAGGGPVAPGNPSEGGPPAGANPHWVSYGGGPKNQFYNAAETKISVETAPMLDMLWNVTIGEVTGAPSIVGDRIYVASNAGLFALETETGKTIWNVGIRSTSAAYYDEESKLVFASDQGNSLHAVDAMTGMTKWTGRISMQGGTGWSSPIVSGNLVVVGVGSIDMGSFKGGVSAFDKMTGTKKWEYTHAKTAGASVWSGPGADDDGVIYATSGNNYGTADDRSDSIFALMPGDSMATMLWNFQGEPNDAWSFSATTAGRDHDFGANPIIVDVKGRKLVAAGRKSGEFHMVDRMTGQEIKRVKLSNATSQANGGILNNGAYDGKNQMFITMTNEAGSPGKTFGLTADPDNPLMEVWSKPNTGVSWAPISTANGVCFITDNSTLRVLNCKDGAELKTFMMAGTIGSAPAISDGKVVMGVGFSYSFGGGTIRGGRNLVALGLK